MNLSLRRLIVTEARLLVREPVALIMVFAFPALTVLILGGVFDENDPAFGGTTPSSYYIASYFGVVLSAVGFIMLPTHLAAYRDRGVLRRFHASPFPPWALPVAWIAVAAVLSAASMVVLVITGQLSYGVPAVDNPIATVAVVLLTTGAFLSAGIFLGLALPTARAAQGVGLALFFTSFLLGGAGPPDGAMSPTMRAVSNALPVTHAVKAIQHSWLGIGESATGHLAVVAASLLVTTVGWVTLANRTSTR